MRCVCIGLIAGVAWLQMQPALAPVPVLLAVLIAAAALLLAASASRIPAYAACGRLGAGAVFGFAWAALFAQHYLAQELAPALEGQDLIVVGVVDSLPYRFDQGVRFNFQIEQASIEGRAVRVPSHVALGWYAGMRGTGAGAGSPLARAPESGVGNTKTGIASGAGSIDAAAAAPGIRVDASAKATDVGPAATGIAVEPGERWQLAVRLQRPHGSANPEGFDYEVWLLEQDLRATGQVRTGRDLGQMNRRLTPFVASFGTLVERARGFLRARILAALPGKPYAGAMVALVIGDQRAIPQSDWKIFNRTGIGHLVSISGLHITMIAGLFAGLAHFLWRRSFFTDAALPLRLPAQKVAALTAALVALLYVLLAGFGVPAQRTLYMLWVVAAALWCARIGSVSHVLCLAGLAVVLLNPWAVLWPGFWLSFGAVAIILYASVGRIRVRRDGLTRSQRLLAHLKEAAHTQYVVTLGLVPLTILLFGQVSLVSPLANAVAIPLVSVLVAPLALAGSILPAPLSAWLLGLAHQLFAWLATLLTWLSGQPGAVWAAPVPAFWMFAAAFVGALWLLAPRGWPVRWAGLVGWLPLVCNAATQPAAGTLCVTAFDVGQGMALLIETAHHRLLYDTGPYYSPESNGGERIIVPYLKSRGIAALDAVIVTHNDNDHSGGALAVFDEIAVGWVASSLAPESPIVHAAPRHRRCVAGQRWTWDGIDFEMLHPDAASYDNPRLKPNARGCTLKVTQGAHALLLAADIEAPQEAALLARQAERLHATVLLAPHHGSGTSSTLPFLQAVQPQAAIFQMGYRNRYHHPKPSIYQRYGELGILRWRNDESGAISLRFGDGVGARVGTGTATGTRNDTAAGRGASTGDGVYFGEYRKMHARYWYNH